jgi:hypothetical protein
VRTLAAAAGTLKSQTAQLKTISETVGQLLGPVRTQSEHLKTLSGLVARMASGPLKSQTDFLKTIAGTAEQMTARPKDLMQHLDRIGKSLQALHKIADAQKSGNATEKRGWRG